MSATASQGISIHPPHIHDWRSTSRVTWLCGISLVPVVAWSAALYGWPAITVWLASVAAAVLSQLAVDALRHRLSLADGSAVLTGLLVATAMPPGIAPHVPAAASAFAVIIVKGVFGGQGSNWMNPALGGIAFAYANWPGAMREFIMPRMLSGVDGLSASTPLAFAKDLASSGSARIMDTIHQAGYPVSALDTSVTNVLNGSLFEHLGARLPDGYVDILLGFRPGALGESALFLVLLGSVFLLSLRLIKAEIPVAMLVVFALLSKLFGTGLPGEAVYGGDALFALGGGGVLFVAFYMATDPVTSPASRFLALFYGALIGTLSYLFRRWGGHPEGVAYAVLIANVVMPTLERRVDPLFRGLARRRPA